MVCLSRPYSFKLFKGYLPQILLGPFLNTLPQMAQLKKQRSSLFLWKGLNCLTTKSWYEKTELFTAKFAVNFTVSANLTF